MEEGNKDNTIKKRARDASEPETHPPESKRVNSASNPSGSDQVGPLDPDGAQNDVVDLDSSDAKQIRDGILDILDDPELDSDRDPEIRDLDSVIKSFEEEILQSATAQIQPEIFDLTSDSGESQPDLGFLLEASDDELGLPPPLTSSVDQTNKEPVSMPEATENVMAIGSELPSYDSFELGIGEGFVNNNGGDGDGDFVTVGGLFDFSEPLDFAEYPWRSESLPAL